MERRRGQIGGEREREGEMGKVRSDREKWEKEGKGAKTEGKREKGEGKGVREREGW